MPSSGSTSWALQPGELAHEEAGKGSEQSDPTEEGEQGTVHCPAFQRLRAHSAKRPGGLRLSLARSLPSSLFLQQKFTEGA